MTGGWIPRRATGLIPGSRGRKTMQGQLVDRMRGRPLLLAEAFGIGPGEVGLGGAPAPERPIPPRHRQFRSTRGSSGIILLNITRMKTPMRTRARRLGPRSPK